jgi:signal transduction histidine kinase
MASRSARPTARTHRPHAPSDNDRSDGDQTRVLHTPAGTTNAVPEERDRRGRARALAAAHSPTHAGVAIETALADAPAIGDRVLLERLAANLIDNATAYNFPGGWVRVATGTRNGVASCR